MRELNAVPCATFGRSWAIARAVRSPVRPGLLPRSLMLTRQFWMAILAGLSSVVLLCSRAEAQICTWVKDPAPAIEVKTGNRGKETDKITYWVQGKDQDTCIDANNNSSLKGDGTINIEPGLGWIGEGANRVPKLNSGRCTNWARVVYSEVDGVIKYELEVKLRMITGRETVSFKDPYLSYDTESTEYGIQRCDSCGLGGVKTLGEVLVQIDHNKGNEKGKVTSAGEPNLGATIALTHLSPDFDDPEVNQDGQAKSRTTSSDSFGEYFFYDVLVGSVDLQCHEYPSGNYQIKQTTIPYDGVAVVDFAF